MLALGTILGLVRYSTTTRGALTPWTRKPDFAMSRPMVRFRFLEWDFFRKN